MGRLARHVSSPPSLTPISSVIVALGSSLPPTATSCLLAPPSPFLFASLVCSPARS
ncbi:unnamed protein product, partial [Closterium sp. Naga37s-1]